MGSIFHAPVSRELEALAFLELAEASRFETVAALPRGGEPPASLPWGRLVVAVGSEGAGLPEEVASACSSRVTIPALAASLNAAMAASILLYEAYTRVLP
jgi:TrmH family RNA methyltransferase